MATSTKKLFEKYLSKVKQLNRDHNANDIYMSPLEGKNHYLRMSHYESSLFDSSWKFTLYKSDVSLKNMLAFSSSAIHVYPFSSV